MGTVIIEKMTDQNYDSAGGAANGDMVRLLLTALAMILVGIAIWEWTDTPTVAPTKPPLILAGQN